MTDKRLNVFVGHFGSGKTEIAINYALKLRQRGLKTMIVDLDVVNPFFRTVELKEYLKSNDITVIAPNFAGTALDVPSLPAALYSAFDDMTYNVVFDVGGDDIGAKVLGNFYPYFRRESYRMFCVLNAKRPLSSTVQDMMQWLDNIQNASRMEITDLINNTNLSFQTTISDVLYGQKLIEEVSLKTKIPIYVISGMPDVVKQLPDEYRDKVMPLKIFLHPPWYSGRG